MLPNKDLLIPGPWTATGNTVRDGYGKTVCVVFTRNATAHAHWIAELPNLIEEREDPVAIADVRADLSDYASDYEKLEKDYDKLVEKLANAEDEIHRLREHLARVTSPPHI